MIRIEYTTNLDGWGDDAPDAAEQASFCRYVEHRIGATYANCEVTARVVAGSAESSACFDGRPDADLCEFVERQIWDEWCGGARAPEVPVSYYETLTVAGVASPATGVWAREGSWKVRFRVQLSDGAHYGKITLLPHGQGGDKFRSWSTGDPAAYRNAIDYRLDARSAKRLDSEQVDLVVKETSRAMFDRLGCEDFEGEEPSDLFGTPPDWREEERAYLARCRRLDTERGAS